MTARLQYRLQTQCEEKAVHWALAKWRTRVQRTHQIRRAQAVVVKARQDRLVRAALAEGMRRVWRKREFAKRLGWVGKKVQRQEMQKAFQLILWFRKSRDVCEVLQKVRAVRSIEQWTS